MAEEIVHKLITTGLSTGYLNELVLCWNIAGAPSPDAIRHTKYSVNINDVTCGECRQYWNEGAFCGHSAMFSPKSAPWTRPPGHPDHTVLRESRLRRMEP